MYKAVNSIFVSTLVSASALVGAPAREAFVAVAPGFMESDSAGAKLSGEQYALGFVVPIRDRWQLNTSLAWEDRDLAFLRPPSGGCIAIFPIPPECIFGTPMSGVAETYALDLVAAYAIGKGSRWQPYVGAGARVDYVDYFDLVVNRGDTLALFAPEPGDSTYGVSPALAVGTSVPLGNRLGLRVDGRYYPETWFEESEQVPDAVQDEVRSDTHLRVGLGWRF